jgi:2-polyprenyl-3-methyl-5-hydroxy-6-metoxy-1,4-benzoquinol methylase
MKMELSRSADTQILPWQMESVTCDTCGSSNAVTVMHGTDTRFHLPGEYTLVRCQNCGLVYMNPRPIASDLGKTYPENYQAFQAAAPPTEATASPLKQRITQIMASHYWDRSELLISAALLPLTLYSRLRGHVFYPPKPGRALDIGCGSGWVMKRLQRLGWEVVGIEPNPEAAQNARTLTGATVYTGYFMDIPLDSESFDLVIVSHVLEHVSDPKATLSEVFSLLKPGGSFFLAIPNFGCIERKLTGANWQQMDLPRHLYFFEPKTLRQALEQVGLKIQRLEFISEGWALRVALLRSMKQPLGSLVDKLLKPITSLFCSVLTLVGTGNIMMAYARKLPRGD